MRIFTPAIIHLLVIALFIGSTTYSFGQYIHPSTDFQQQLGVSWKYTSLDDNLLSDHALSGNAVKLSYDISMSGIKRKTTLNAAYQSGRYPNGVNESNTNGKISENAFSVSLSDGFNVLSRNRRRFAIYVGYQISTYSSYTWKAANNSSKGQYSWFSYNTAALYQSYSYWWSAQSLSLDISIPVIGITYRPESENTETGFTNTRELNHVLTTLYSNPSFSSVHNNLMADLTLSYKRTISQRISLSANYSFSYPDIET